MSDQRIDAPTDQDIDSIARAWLHADETCREVLASGLDGTQADLVRFQRLLDSGSIAREATYTLQSLGIAFGKVFVNANPGYDWWMVEDEYGRDPAIRYEQSSLLSFPKTMISKRIEDGETVDILELYEGLVSRLSQLVEEGHGAM